MPNYSEQDIKFLKALKQQGVPAEEALQRLQGMKGSQTTQPNQPLPSGQPDLSAMQSQIKGGTDLAAGLMNPGAAIGNFIGSNAGMIGNAILDSTVKPITRGVGSAAVTGFKDLQAVGSAFGEIQKLKHAGKDIYSNEKVMLDKTPEQIHAEATAPVDVPWLGNLNANKAGMDGMYDPYSSLAEQSARGVDAGVGFMNLFNPSTGVGANAFRGGAQAGAQAFQEEGANPLSVGASALFGAATSAAVTGLTNKLSAWLAKGGSKTIPTKLEKEAINAGIKPDAIKRVQTLSPEDKVTQSQLIDLARQNLDDPDNVQTPMEKIANDMNDDMRELYRVMQEKGAAIGQIKGDVITGQLDAPNINVKDLRKDFLTSLAKKGVIVGNDGKLSFNKSVFKNQKGDQKALLDVWNSIRKVDDIPTSNGLILREQLQGDLYGGKMRGDITTAEKFITDFERGLTKKIHADNPDLAELDDVFYNLKKAVSGFDDKTGGVYPTHN
jgi:hypothetical protein